MQPRAKLTCINVENFSSSADDTRPKDGEKITFETVYNSEDSQADNNFSKFTPSANFLMYLTNESLFGAFEVGKAYYFDITACEQ